MVIKKSRIEKRKLEHTEIVRFKDVEPVKSDFSKYSLPYKALPEISLDEIETSLNFFGKKISMPLMVASMTGGPKEVSDINKNLALACEEKKIPLALGSMRIILKEPASLESFAVRKFCPSIPLFANLGIVQLNYGYGYNEINKLVDSIEADGIFLHINHLQEALQPEGDTDFRRILPKLAHIIKKINRPVLAKEVGSGIDKETAQRLFDIGVRWIDTAGLGGTNWTIVEGFRKDIALGKEMCRLGLQTTESILQLAKIKGLGVIAGGGIRSGVDIAKSLALGAKLASAAKPFLEPALKDKKSVIKKIDRFSRELRIAMFSAGVINLSELSKLHLIRVNP